jgi:predicted metalloendopeptidase
MRELRLRLALGSFARSGDRTIGGLNGDQRFFLAFARRWQKLQTEAAPRDQVKADAHAPGPYRSDTVRNVDAWYAAFGVRSGDELYIDPKIAPGSGDSLVAHGD